MLHHSAFSLHAIAIQTLYRFQPLNQMHNKDSACISVNLCYARFLIQLRDVVCSLFDVIRYLIVYWWQLSVITYQHTLLHLQSTPYDTCSRTILWCWYSWHQRDSCEQDEDIHLTFDQGNTHPHLKSASWRGVIITIKARNDFIRRPSCIYDVAPTQNGSCIPFAFLSSFVVVRHWNSVLLVSRGKQRQLHIRLTERELNGIAVTNFPSMIAENFREFIDELHYNCCRRVKSCF